MFFSPFYLLLLVFIAIGLFVFGFSLFFSSARQSSKKKLKKVGKPGAPGTCPVCGVVLTPGQQIKSAVFPGGNDRICHIFGCPNCLPYPEPDVRRVCPVCRKDLKPDEYLVARVFYRTSGKNHVHILGCVNCRNGAHNS